MLGPVLVVSLSTVVTQFFRPLKVHQLKVPRKKVQLVFLRYADEGDKKSKDIFCAEFHYVAILIVFFFQTSCSMIHINESQCRWV